MTDNVKDIYTMGSFGNYNFFYITKDNKLFSTKNELIADNVKKYDYGYYITTTNELFEYNNDT